MAPKGTPSKRKGQSAPTPLSLYKRGLTAIRGWSPLTSASSDGEALAALTDCCSQLQTRMGGAPPPPPPPPPPPGEAPIDGPATTTSGGGPIGNGHPHTHTQRQLAAPAAEGNGCGCGGAAGEEASATGAQPDPLAAAWAALDALTPGMSSYKAVVRHSLDLDLEDWEDEPGFLLASCHLEIGKLLGRMFPRREVGEQRHLEAALALFPDFVAAGVALGQALLARADQPEQLLEAERRLRAALAVAERLGGGGGGATEKEGEAKEGDGEGDADGGGEMLLAANAACRREWEAGAAARRSLAMLLCQEGRDAEAAEQLAALDFTHRLARQVLHYPLDPQRLPAGEQSGPGPLPPPPSGPLADWPRYLGAVDGALPPALLQVLRTALVPGGRFWAEHGYGRVGYFSYMHELGSPALSAIHQAATLVQRLAAARFPAVAEARYAEWWAHCRRHPSGHQLHFDSDDEGVGGVRNPILSGVIYLTGGIGGPTLVTPQLLGGPLAPHGWLVHPRENRLAWFDSTVLHGVIPGRGPSPRPGEYRITLMIAFWRDIQCRPRDDGLPGPSQPFPRSPGSPAAPGPRYSWMQDLPPHPEGTDGWGTADPRDAVPTAIDRVWERLDGSPAQPGAVQYDACFQGF